MAEAKETYERVVTPDELVKMANEMAARAKKTPTEQRSALFLEFYRTHREVCQAYPIVVKMMCYLDMYNAGVFKKYIILSAKMPRKTREEYHEIQAKYVRMINRKYYPRESPAYYRHVYNESMRLLKEEAEDHEKLLKEAEETVKEKDQQYKEELRKDLAEKLRAGPPKPGIVVETAESPNVPVLPEEEPPALEISSASLFI